jgi:hypothetical protein
MGGLDDEAEEGDVIGEEDISKYTVGAPAASQAPFCTVPCRRSPVSSLDPYAGRFGRVSEQDRRGSRLLF